LTEGTRRSLTGGICRALVPSEVARRANEARWAKYPDPEQRRKQTRKARLTHAVNELVNQWPELTPEQVARLRTLLQPVGGDLDDAA
jgi:hypothetical protein